MRDVREKECATFFSGFLLLDYVRFCSPSRPLTPAPTSAGKL